jgi:hypothetical protein
MAMTETLKVWQCIGCGRVEGPAQCIGVCEDRLVDLVSATDYHADLARMEARAAALEEVVRRIALTYPKKGEWESTWKAMQAQAKRALDAQLDGHNHAIAQPELNRRSGNENGLGSA